MLSISLAKFVQESSSNADISRGYYAIAAGIAMVIVATAPVLVTLIEAYPRWIRLSTFPLLWVGLLTTLGGYSGKQLDLKVYTEVLM